jgi:hypothetical protein
VQLRAGDCARPDARGPRLRLLQGRSLRRLQATFLRHRLLPCLIRPPFLNQPIIPRRQRSLMLQPGLLAYLVQLLLCEA